MGRLRDGLGGLATVVAVVVIQGVVLGVGVLMLAATHCFLHSTFPPDSEVVPISDEDAAEEEPHLSAMQRAVEDRAQAWVLVALAARTEAGLYEEALAARREAVMALRGPAPAEFDRWVRAIALGEDSEAASETLEEAAPSEWRNFTQRDAVLQEARATLRRAAPLRFQRFEEIETRSRTVIAAWLREEPDTWEAGAIEALSEVVAGWVVE